jgi:glycosyltransferase involved in cell wall biosynthesis
MLRKRRKVCFVATVDVAISSFLIGHLLQLQKLYDLTIITNVSGKVNFLDFGVNAKVINLKFSRKFSLFSDFYCLLKLFYIFRREKFSVVHSITPKAGLLSMLASFFSKVPFRVHCFTGQPWALNTGIKRLFLKYIDKTIVKFSSYNIIDSPSQRLFLLNEGILNSRKAFVFGLGSISGVDLLRFKSNKRLGKQTRRQLALPLNSFVFIYLGRLTNDKGVLDLAYAFSKLNNPSAYLLFVGPDEKDFTAKIKIICTNKIQNIRFVDFTDMPHKFLCASNILCLPSYREGFGTVILEAAAMGIPAIASNIYGIVDAVKNNQTGILFKAGDIFELKKTMNLVIKNPVFLAKLGRSARKRATIHFSSYLLTNAWLSFYKRYLN